MRSINELVPPIENDTTKEITTDNEVVAKMVKEMQTVVKESLEGQRIATDRMTEVLKSSITNQNNDNNNDESEDNEHESSTDL